MLGRRCAGGFSETDRSLPGATAAACDLEFCVGSGTAWHGPGAAVSVMTIAGGAGLGWSGRVCRANRRRISLTVSGINSSPGVALPEVSSLLSVAAEDRCPQAGFPLSGEVTGVAPVARMRGGRFGWSAVFAGGGDGRGRRGRAWPRVTWRCQGFPLRTW
jgi:hypothetical protein